VNSDADIREQVEAIQRALRRSGREMVLPGTQAMVRGVLVLLGCGASYRLVARPWWQTALVWVAVLVLIIAVEAGLYLRLLAKDPEKFVTGMERQMLKFFALILAAGAILNAALLIHGRDDLVAGVWMILIGTAYVTVGLFSFSDTWVLGLLACAGGAVALFLVPAHSLAILALTLGVGSVGWGLVVKARERRGES